MYHGTTERNQIGQRRDSMHFAKGLFENFVTITIQTSFGIFQIVALRHDFAGIGFQKEEVQKCRGQCGSQSHGDSFRHFQWKATQGKNLGRNERKRWKIWNVRFS
jgi:hypothetical protein